MIRTLDEWYVYATKRGTSGEMVWDILNDWKEQDSQIDTRQRNILEDLQFVTKDCRPDMHEPDEQGISAIVTGYNFDNAMGADPYNNCQELTVAIVDSYGNKTWFNLADLIALARMAK